MLEIIILISCLSATLLICFEKWGWLQQYDIYYTEWQDRTANLLISLLISRKTAMKLAYYLIPERCMFCFGFRIALLLSLPVVIVTGSWPYLLIPFVTAPITLKLI